MSGRDVESRPAQSDNPGPPRPAEFVRQLFAPLRERVDDLLEPHVEKRLITDRHEQVVEEVHKHWVTIIVPVLGLVGTMFIFLTMPFLGRAFWLSMIAGLALMGWSLWSIHREYMDRFVITNMRVFRVRGVFTRHLATMPIGRILDIAVYQPFFGRVFDYGHFTFESAAQDQGLREIRFVGQPAERDRTIQRVLDMSGIRGFDPREILLEDPEQDDSGLVAEEQDVDGTGASGIRLFLRGLRRSQQRPDLSDEEDQ